jgi:penicillin-binding protein 1A
MTPPARTWWPNTSATAKDPLSNVGMMVDGGFAMGENLPLFAYGETDAEDVAVTNSSGETRVIPKKADFGTLSSGGLY